MLLSVLPATSMAASYATVVGGWLRLRSAPNFSASTITSYYTGTQVEILGSSGGWYKVQTPDGRTGYMYGNYLRMGGSVPSEGTAYVTSYNGYGVRLRTGPGTGYRIIRTYAVGTPVTVLERGTYWSRISIGGTVGYMMSQFLHFGSDYPDDSNVLCYATISVLNLAALRQACACAPAPARAIPRSASTAWAPRWPCCRRVPSGTASAWAAVWAG